MQHSAIGYHRELRPFDTITIQILRILEQAIFNSITHLERLLANFDKLSVAAIGLSSPNKEDDEFIRCGMIGFAHSSSLENWTIDHFRYVRRIRDEMMPLEFTVNWRRFACLASGYFLGMYVAELLDNAGLRLAEAQTPGFMWLHAESFGDE